MKTTRVIDFFEPLKIKRHTSGNKQHEVLDIVAIPTCAIISEVSFGEDLNIKKGSNAAQNFSLINKIALNLAKKESSKKLGIKSKLKISVWDENYLLKILGL